MSNSKKKYILAIDHGTSGSKTALVSTHGEVIDFAFEEVPLHVFKGGGVEQDPKDWWSAIMKTSKQVIDKSHVPTEDIVGICNASQWSGTVAVDKDGNQLMDSIIWMDTRGAPHLRNLFKGLIKVAGYPVGKILKLLKKTGGAPMFHGKDSIAHILYIKNELPDIYNKTHMFLEPQDYVNFKFTGNYAASHVSIHLHWLTDIRDINNIQYSKELMKMFKVDPSKFPAELKSSIDILGPVKKEVADELGLSKDTKVIMGAPDTHTACIGSGAVRDYEGHICIGTSDWIFTHIPYKKTDIFHNMASLPGTIPGKYMVGNEQEIAGGALSFLRDNILYHKDELLREEAVPDVYKIFDKLAESVPAGSDNLIFTPWLIGERSPVDDDTIRGGLYNLSLEMSRAHIIRSIFEGVAMNIKWLLFYVEKFIKKWVMKERQGVPKNTPIMPELNIMGGGANSNIWCQIVADVLDRKINQVKDPIQANARGAAFIGAVGLGLMDWYDIPKYIEFSNVFTPNPDNRKTYDNLYSEFLNIYDVMKKPYKRLNSR